MLDTIHKSTFEWRASIISTQVLKTDYKSPEKKENYRTTDRPRICHRHHRHACVKFLGLG